MFMIKNVSKYLFGDTSKEVITEIPQGQLYLVRPLSPKGYSELIYKDAVATIRRTGQEFHYQLVVQRAYEEGEEELAEDDEDAGAEGLDKDEKTFLLDQSLHFRSEDRSAGESILAWRDLSGDPGDLYEFVCDSSVQEEKIQTFLLAAIDCQFERKYRRSAQRATDSELREFYFETDDAIPAASSAPAPVDPKPNSKETAERMAKDVRTPKKSNVSKPKESGPTEAPPARSAPAPGESLTQQGGELHLFDFPTGTFILQDPAVTAVVTDLGKWRYWLQITSSTGREWLGQSIVPDINPVFNFDYLSAIFNHYTDDGSAYSWLLRFKDQATLENFQEGVMQALWEQLNEMKWSKVKDQEREYVLEAFNDLTMDDAKEAAEEAEGEEEESDESDSEGRPQSEHYDDDESEDDVDLDNKDGNVNSQLAVGTKHDRSFVIRGSKIGVFKHMPNKHLEFTTNISKVETPKGKLFSPSKVMLHSEDQNMVLQDPNNPNLLYRMDLEYGKIVDEWKVHDDIPVTNFAPETKFAQQTSAQPFIGHSANALFRIDPRVSGNKLVEAQLKQYLSKNDFSAAATTEKGYIALASNKGDVRLYDRLGINAKTQIPALGESIVGLDVSADGRWILGTCKTYLILIDSLQKDGKNEGKLGFEKAFAKDSKPQPRRLALSPNHAAQFQHETGQGIAFTRAHFNTGPDVEETSIITSTGPFLVTWSLKKVLKGQKDPYQIKRYAAEVMADNFEYGSDKNVILALPNEVDMVSRKSFKKPTRESIMGAPARASGVGMTPRRSGRQSHLRDDIVNSPY
ncbi:Vacuolar import and degradation protein 27 [Cladophialophora chaetospira]|uniref:Vacuolar import and degradation protein 27 n=1 Tax=Cladophialophora chaetospira TaxID=386627 RepID=A0AA38XEL7_9EURO|nr:Vacuolar import and degradation protein 27 [Cladophialophora chaetospira]